MQRRTVVASVAALLFGPPRAFAQAPAPPPGPRSIAVLQIELLDDQNNPATKAAQEVRLRDALLQLRKELGERGLYRVVDPGPAQALQEHLRAQQEFFYRCDDCAAQVGRQLGVDLVMTPWVQKVSELILNFNVQIFDVPAGKVIFSKSVDMRGNEDESWRRAVRYLVRDMAEKRSIHPGYGQ
ncbi:DUF3280 domain-containing protein [Ramlibacter sp. AN1133]|uniref:DUF3280 domain-containing protein n=1 Tax=Ramlibacter sp. AN1133 TaxID=3133429 RepID=UPI0030C02C4E